MTADDPIMEEIKAQTARGDYREELDRILQEALLDLPIGRNDGWFLHELGRRIRELVACSVYTATPLMAVQVMTELSAWPTLWVQQMTVRGRIWHRSRAMPWKEAAVVAMTADVVQRINGSEEAHLHMLGPWREADVQAQEERAAAWVGDGI